MCILLALTTFLVPVLELDFQMASWIVTPSRNKRRLLIDFFRHGFGGDREDDYAGHSDIHIMPWVGHSI